MRIPIVGGHYSGRSIVLNPQQTINLYPVMSPNGKYESALFGTPGLVLFCNLGSAVQVRAMRETGDYLYAVGGNTLYKIDSSGNAVSISGTLSTSTGPVYMEDDGTNLMIVDPGVDGYTYDTVAGGSLSVIADADFPSAPLALTWQDGYFIVNTANQYNISTLYNPTQWDAADFKRAEAQPDALRRAFSDREELWLPGAKTTEVHYNSGAAAFPFSRIPGAVIPYGTDSPASVAAGDNAIFWLDNFNRVLRADGFVPQVISTPELEYHINQYADTGDAIGFCYTQEGTGFYVLIFPTGNMTWAYDFSSGEWHQRRSFPVLANGGHGRHRANCYAKFGRKHLIGDWGNGKIYQWSLDAFDDAGETMRAARTFRVVHQDRKNIFFHRLEVECEPGVGLASGQGSDPIMMMRMSNDGGRTYGNEHWRSMGKIGEYKRRAVWNRLGRSRNRVFEISITDPVKRVIMAAHLEAESGVS